MLIRFFPEDRPVATGYLPFSAMIHDFDFDDMWNTLRIFNGNVELYLQAVYKTEIGDYYESRGGAGESLSTDIEDSVIILGDYDGGQHEAEMKKIRDYLESKGYRPSLIKELPSHPSHSLTRKVKMWCLTSRFVVLIDREPSGHIREYSDLSSEDVPLALIRESDTGSTFMIGHERLTDDYIEPFEFETAPSETVDDVVSWAEEFIDEISSLYNEEYPWR